MKPFFKNGGSEPLMHPGPTSAAMIPAAVWLPAELVGLPRSPALEDQIFLVLLCLLAVVACCFVMDVVRLVFIDLGASERHAGRSVHDLGQQCVAIQFVSCHGGGLLVHMLQGLHPSVSVATAVHCQAHLVFWCCVGRTGL